MKKKLFHDLRRMVIGIIILMILCSTVIVTIFNIGTNKREIETMYNQMVEKYEVSKENYKSKIDLFRKDYLNRCFALSYFLSSENSLIDNSELNELRILMEVSSINLIDFDNKVVQSTDESLKNIDFDDVSEYDDFVSFLADDEVESYYSYVKKPFHNLEDEASYFAVKIESNIYHAILLEVNYNVFGDIVRENSLATLVKQTVKVSGNEYFLMDVTTKEIVGISKESENMIGDLVNNADLFIKLSNKNSMRFINIDGKFYFSSSYIIEGQVLGILISASKMINDIILSIILIAISLSIVSIVSPIYTNSFLKREVFNDFMKIENSVSELLSGKLNVKFYDFKYEEFKKISEALKLLQKSYLEKNSRITRLTQAISKNIAAFEVIYGIDVFLSNNMQALLHLTDKEWDDIYQDIDKFKNFILYLKSLEDENKIINYNGLYLEIDVVEQENSFNGVIKNRTDEILNKLELEQKIIHFKSESETDPLTNLLNRKGFTAIVSDLIKTNQRGILFGFDLDNFKRVNDSEGHLVGDKVLQIFSNVLKKVFVNKSTIARIGGDEFLIFIDVYFDKSLIERKMKLFYKTLHCDLKYYIERYEVSSSVGIAYFSDEVNSYHMLYEACDAALYNAKKFGRNNYSVYKLIKNKNKTQSK